MLRSTLLHVARRHLRWLLCFALLLPVAQWASLAHAFTHTANAGSRSGPEPGVHLQHCPVCPIAAAVAAGGLASGPSGLASASRGEAAAAGTPVRSEVRAAVRRPTNRGPPISSPDR